MLFPKRSLFPTLPLAVLAAVTFFAFVNSAPAQVLYGSLTGNVTDASGAAIPGVKVEAVNGATGAAKQSVTDEHGTYLFSDLQPGTYKVTIAAPAFSTRIFEGVTVSLNS